MPSSSAQLSSSPYYFGALFIKRMNKREKGAFGVAQHQKSRRAFPPAVLPLLLSLLPQLLANCCRQNKIWPGLEGKNGGSGGQQQQQPLCTTIHCRRRSLRAIGRRKWKKTGQIGRAEGGKLNRMMLLLIKEGARAAGGGSLPGPLRRPSVLTFLAKAIGGCLRHHLFPSAGECLRGGALICCWKRPKGVGRSDWTKGTTRGQSSSGKVPPSPKELLLSIPTIPLGASFPQLYSAAVLPLFSVFH